MAKSKSRRTRKPRPTTRAARPSGAMVFERRNYLLLLLGLALVVAGYVIMRAENEVDGFLSLYVAPLMILGGYLEVIYAILWRPKGTRREAPVSEREAAAADAGS